MGHVLVSQERVAACEQARTAGRLALLTFATFPPLLRDKLLSGLDLRHWGGRHYQVVPRTGPRCTSAFGPSHRFRYNASDQRRAGRRLPSSAIA